MWLCGSCVSVHVFVLKRPSHTSRACHLVQNCIITYVFLSVCEECVCMYVCCVGVAVAFPNP